MADGADDGARRWRLSGPALHIAAAVALAAAELIAGVRAGLPYGFPRAEALVFLDLRPWLLLLLALLAARRGWRSRLAAYALFLAAAGLGESCYLIGLGNSAPWAEMLRGWAAGALLLLVFDGALQLCRRRFAVPGLGAAAAGLAALLALSPILSPYRDLVDGPEPLPTTANRPRLLVMTALPIVWGEGGAFDPESRPAGIYRVLQREFAVEPLDTLDAAGLAGGRLLLLAQPRWLAPAELVAVDSWVRAGGRILVLTDPALEWPTDLPLGDLRRPPATGLLAPLLDHWGLALAEGGSETAIALNGRRLALHRPGRFDPIGAGCASVRPSIAECRVGNGRAILIADADLMRDDLWMAAGRDGESRRSRIADNPLVVADLLDSLAGTERPRTLAAIRWAEPGTDRDRAAGVGVIALLLIGAAAFGAARFR